MKELHTVTKMKIRDEDLQEVINSLRIPLGNKVELQKGRTKITTDTTSITLTIRNK